MLKPTRESAHTPTREQDGLRPDLAELLALRLESSGLLSARGRIAAAPHGGTQRSRFRGRGMDYAESRIYQPGDDIRHMDWRVTARTGRAHTKLYQEERERPVVVVADFGPTMFFGTRRALKSVIAARAAALIGWAAVSQGDRIGALLCNGSHHELRPAGGRRGVIRLIRNLVTAADPHEALQRGRHSAGLASALSRLRRVARPGSLVVIISDFYTIDEEIRSQLMLVRRHNDLLACRIVDPLELQPPPKGRYTISDGNRRRTLDTSERRSRERYINYCRMHQQQLSALTRSLSVPLVTLRTDCDVPATLREALAPAGSRPPKTTRGKAL